MNASRLLFEGLEDRIMLDGAPAALLGAVIHEESYAHLEGFVMADTDITFVLPKFDDHGGTRTLVGVRLESTTTVTDGEFQAENTDGAFTATLTAMTLALTVESHVFVIAPVGPPPVGPAAFDFTPPALTTSITPPITLGVAGPTQWADDGDPSDFHEIDVIGKTTGVQSLTVAAGSPQLNDFIQAPGDTEILFSATSATSADVTFVGSVASRTLPLIVYDMTGAVYYQWTEGGDIPPYTDETFYGTKPVFEKAPPPLFQPFYSGTAQPGATLTVDVLGVGGEMLGSTSAVVDAGGNWAASFYDLRMTGEPHTVSIRQSYTGYTPLAGAGYNLRRYFSPAILGGAYASERLTVENVLGNRSAEASMAALYSASAHPISLGLAPYGFEMLPLSASPQGLH